MSTYFFRTNHIPGVIVTDSRPATVTYALNDGRNAATIWGGVMERYIASSLKPWAKPVPLTFTAFQCGAEGWRELSQGEYLWGVVLRGYGVRETALFALLSDGYPVIARRKNGRK
jgi:hypothetical protein